MKIGHLKQKATSPMVVFVLGCCIIITGLLWSMQKAVARGEGFYESNAIYATYLD